MDVKQCVIAVVEKAVGLSHGKKQLHNTNFFLSYNAKGNVLQWF